MTRDFATHPVTWALVVLAFVCTAGTLFAWGVDDPEHPEGVSVRQGSVYFFSDYRRSHPNGGLDEGK